MKNNEDLYDIFLKYSYSQLKELFSNAKNKEERRINTDEMVARVGSWKDNNLQIQCAREAVKLIKQYISQGISFNQETTFSGKSIIKNIKEAK